MADGSRARVSVGRRLKRAALALGITGLLLLAIGLPLAAPVARAAARGAELGYAHPAAGPDVPPTLTVRVTLTDAPSFVPSNVTANASQTVVFSLVNTGRIAHTFTLARTPNAVLNRSWSPTQLDSFFAKNGSYANVSLAPGASANATVALPASAAGSKFPFVSVVPYQFQAGMQGTLDVVAAPTGKPLTASESTAGDGILSFVPSTLVVNATTFPVTLTVTFSDGGVLPHTFTLSPLANTSLNPSNYTSFFSAHPPLANIMLSGSGASGSQTFTLPKKGIYEFICTVPGHFASGMNGSLYAGIPYQFVPPPSAAIVQVPILLGAAGLFGVGVLLALVAAYTGRWAGGTRPPSGSEHR
jgi:uncharacterized cupredoxin-like copper-binding protein